jgi:hypothetical protein
MKIVLATILSFLIAGVALATSISQTQLTYIKTATLKQGVVIENYPDAHQELKEQVSACGLGVVQGWQGINRCTHTIKVDDWFLRPMAEKTGYIEEKNWAQQEGVQFISATQKEMEELPDHWDLSDVGEMTDIHRQDCGDCWSTSSRKLLEQALVTHGVRTETGELVQLSAQTTLSSCCTWCGSCNGGYMRTPDFFSQDKSYQYGLPTRELDPYRGSNSSCKFSSQELKSFAPKLVSAPYVGSSLNHSRFFKGITNGPKVKNTMALMMKYKSNALVTISAISSNGGIITNCSNINSGGNHMQNIVGWYQNEGETIARVQNSWGTSHGQDGYTHLKWECGSGRFNRGLGVSTRVGIFEAPGVCAKVADAYVGSDRKFVRVNDGDSVVLGRPSKIKQSCTWLPKAGILETLSDDGCMVRVSPKVATEYHKLAQDPECGSVVSSMVLVTPVDRRHMSLSGSRVLTPHGEVKM